MWPIVTDVPWSVCQHVCLLDTLVSRAKTAEPIEMPFGLWTSVGQRNQALDEAQILPTGRVDLLLG